MAVILCGLGGCLPPQAIDNQEISKGLDTTPEWIESRTGIRERRMVSAGIGVRELAIKAGARAIASAGGRRIDALVVATTSPERICPAVAPEVAARLELGDIAAYDMTSACSGFVYGLATAAGLIAAGIADTVLLIGAEAFTTFVNPHDRSTRPIFGDGAGAVVLRRGEAEEAGSLGCFDLGSDGGRSDLLAIPAGGSRQRGASGGLGHGNVAADEFFLHMEGRAVYEQAVARMAASAQAVLDRAQWSMEQVDWFVGHQANVRILQTVAFELGLEPEKVAVNIERLGNTLTASIPLLLNDLALRGDLQAGQRVLVSAFGAGLSWGSTVLRWPQLNTRDSEWQD
ncbi:ketoacyl-ACP synthase III [Pseudomonas parafulva]|uniref:Beta-ketoacyl-[acyl-carrier-protein] synthase III n=1 Tax=Pseudomonas parafulva TaxID=157782 RepID=A0AAI8K9I7_9PSED|nr:beta-ketoacyl-ACP synthase III [Pseudomonas parafulva]AIZ32117.1 3-oxoacyl-ACP synthase [Pseudomonas parafulva]AXO87607.1 ketoacyl-ACP synthase III [Pseudomonas parafulva]